MTAKIIDGKAIAKKLRAEYHARVDQLRSRYSLTPALAVILVGDNPASQSYVRNKIAGCTEVGIRSELIELPATTSEEQLLEHIDRLNDDITIHGILLQLPLPAHIRIASVLGMVTSAASVLVGQHDFSAFRAAEWSSRNREAFRKLLFAFHGILGTDRFSVYRIHDKEKRQLCWAHLLRNFLGLEELGGTATSLGVGGQRIVKAVFREWYRFRDGEITRRGLQRRLAPFRLQLQRLLRRHVNNPAAPARSNSSTVRITFMALP